jgi:homoserine O-acetyltransferase
VTARSLNVHTVPHFALECGTVLHDVHQAYYLDGTLNDARDNLVIVLHALTGNADAAGEWWREVIGPGRAIDTDRYAVLAPNLLGSRYGSTGPSTYDGGAFPPITPRDQARFIGLLVDALGVSKPALVVGGSLGGMVALEWALEHPGRSRGTVVLAAPAAHTAYANGWNHIQRELVQRFGTEGIALARQVAMMTFRTEGELGARFGRDVAADGRWQVGRWLEHHGQKLVARFDAATYITLLGAMDAHDVGRGRGGMERALGMLTGHVVAVGIPGDLLYSAEEVQRWAALAGAAYREINSVHGHDAFLIEHEQVACILAEALAATSSGVADVAGGTCGNGRCYADRAVV